MTELMRPEWWSNLLTQHYDWFLEIGLALAAVFLVSIFWRRLRKRMIKHSSESPTSWGHTVLDAIGVPINWIILVMGLFWMADISAQHFARDITGGLMIGRPLILTFLVAWMAWRLVERLEERQLTKGNDANTVQLVGNLAKVVVSVVIVMPVLQVMGVTISGMLAFGGVGGLIVGMAAKDLLANFFGSFIIYMDRPFKVGDWVRSPDRNIEGTVEKIGFRVTCIRTFDKRPLYVPNAVFTSISVENPSRMRNRRIKETIGLRYQDASKMATVLSKVETLLRTHPDIATDQIIMVNFNSYGPSSLDFFIYCFTKTTDWATYHKVKQDVLLKIMDIIHAEGADCAFPTRTLHVESMPEAGAGASGQS